MKNILECCGSGDCFATPMNTLGAGNVEPLNVDPIPNKITRKKRKFKSLKEYLKHKNKINKQ